MISVPYPKEVAAVPGPADLSLLLVWLLVFLLVACCFAAAYWLNRGIHYNGDDMRLKRPSWLDWTRPHG